MKSSELDEGAAWIARVTVLIAATLCASPAPAIELPIAPLSFKTAPPPVWSVSFSGGSVPLEATGGKAPLQITVTGAPSEFAPYIQIADPPLPNPPTGSTNPIGGAPSIPAPAPSLPDNPLGLPVAVKLTKVLKLLPMPGVKRVPGLQFSVIVHALDASGRSITAPVQVTMTPASGIPVISSVAKLTQAPSINPDSSNLFGLQIANFSPNDAERAVICRYTRASISSRVTDHLCALQAPQGSQIVVRVPDSGRGFTVQLLALNRQGFSGPVAVEPRGTEMEATATQEFSLHEGVPPRARTVR